MLTIQRASAGSGKTYTLAKTFIRLLITRKDGKGNITLRREKDIISNLRHILAVTFTNKATLEMKQRIIDRLADISVVDENTILPEDTKEWPDYLAEISAETGEPPIEVAKAARTALSAILLSYSDFNVSTIDSFFQTILRTFAYETDMNDSYQLEIDSAATTTAGVDAILERIAHENDYRAKVWIDRFMEDSLSSGKSWNIYQKSRSPKSLYQVLLKITGELENEQYKQNKDQLDRYFNSGHDLYKVLDDMESVITGPVKAAFKDAGEKAEILTALFDKAGLEISSYGSAYLEKRLRDCQDPTHDFFKPVALAKSPFQSKLKYSEVKNLPLYEEITEAYSQYSVAVNKWRELAESRDVKLYRCYEKLLPYLPLLHNISEEIQDILERQNSMQISDTNTLLQRIIGEDETPFIYERLGSRINHFLIDEFQDTSLLQWDNFYPLLSESLSKGYDNLIIGDAKQSIYRFRNAESSLITDIVPSQFPSHHAAGDSAEENANHRSLLNVVEFNNSFFRYLSERSGPFLSNLYSNVEQQPKNTERLGYVEINLYGYSGTENDDEPTENSQQPPQIRNAGIIVESILQRGYSQRDIAFLVVTNKEGADVIKSLVDYNSNIGPEGRKIEFISDQSLLLKNSQAIKSIVSSLRAIAEGLDSRTDAEGDGYHTADWSKISSRFAYLSALDSNAEPYKIINDIINGTPPEDELSEMLQKMQAVTLPSLAEAITERFVDRNLRQQDAVFIAAFQDLILEYCETKPTDISSFLQWWDRNSYKLSISSPEEVDAVRIITIHKSKGLEFPVVIIPKFNVSFKEDTKEWKWVETDPNFPFAKDLPEVLPVLVDKELEDTPHIAILEEERLKARMDALNLAYVAFTRAVNELYVYAPLTLKKGKIENRQQMGNYMLDFFKDHSAIGDKHIEGSVENIGSGTSVFKFGQPLSDSNLEELEKKKLKRKKIGKNRTKPVLRLITDYKVSTECGMLQYIQPDEPEAESGEDPREIGNIMHDIMQRVVTVNDIPKAVRHSVIRGTISPEEGEEIEKTLKAALKETKAYGWFSPGLRVLNERSIVSENHKGFRKTVRPDRIIVDNDKNAVIVDYKFGHLTDVDEYRCQVRTYMESLLRSGRFNSVRGYLWFVLENKVEEIGTSTFAGN